MSFFVVVAKSELIEDEKVIKIKQNKRGEEDEDLLAVLEEIFVGRIRWECEVCGDCGRALRLL